MSKPEFKPFPLRLVYPDFDHSLTDLVVELDHLRRKNIIVSSHPEIFMQLKKIFHTLESIASARIEGNNTTLAEYIDTKIEDTGSRIPGIREIENLERTMSYIENKIDSVKMNEAFIKELHKQVVQGLPFPPAGEGDRNPGRYRMDYAGIGRSSHVPPPPYEVNKYMKELLGFIQTVDAPKYDLLKSAIAHHRFVWIHPFSNGNGRTVRMLTYAMLIKQGFRVNVNRIINPAAVFCSDRFKYYEYLAKADTGESKGMLEWCQYVLQGLKDEMEKIDRLADKSYLTERILFPALAYSVKMKYITVRDALMLKIAVEKQEVQASDFKGIFRDKLPQEISRQLKRLRDLRLLTPVEQGGRKYIFRFNNNFLLRGVMFALDKEGLLPIRGELQ
jgi:Fic family protein